MVIEVLSQKYNTKSNAGIGVITESGILKRLNSIIEWPRSTFPSTIEVKTKFILPIIDDSGNVVPGTEETEGSIYLEDRNFLGTNPELKPGNCFLFRGQVIAVKSENELVNVISETTQFGELALSRFISDFVEPEEEIRREQNEVDDSIKVVEIDTIPDNFTESITLPYCYHSVWKGMTEGSDKIFKCSIFPASIILDGWKVRYDSELFSNEDAEYLKEVAGKCMAWISKNNPKQDIHIPLTIDQAKQNYIALFEQKLRVSLDLIKEIKAKEKDRG